MKTWILKQLWRDLLFLHWSIPVEKLQPYIPHSLQLDTYDGKAWIGFVFFHAKRTFFRGMPSIVHLPSFAEVNIRTYVLYKGLPGVYFLSLDTEDIFSNTLAKRWFHLPYRSAQISLNVIGNHYQFTTARTDNKKKVITAKGQATISQHIFSPPKDSLAAWLTERYYLFSNDKQNHLYLGKIEHPSWLLQEAEVNLEKNNLLASHPIELSTKKPIAHYASGLDVLIWNRKKLT